MKKILFLSGFLLIGFSFSINSMKEKKEKKSESWWWFGSEEKKAVMSVDVMKDFFENIPEKEPDFLKKVNVGQRYKYLISLCKNQKLATAQEMEKHIKKNHSWINGVRNIFDGASKMFGGGSITETLVDQMIENEDTVVNLLTSKKNKKESENSNELRVLLKEHLGKTMHKKHLVAATGYHCIFPVLKRLDEEKEEISKLIPSPLFFLKVPVQNLVKTFKDNEKSWLYFGGRLAVKMELGLDLDQELMKKHQNNSDEIDD